MIPTDILFNTQFEKKIMRKMFVAGEPWDSGGFARAGEEGNVGVLQAERRRLQELHTSSEAKQDAGGRRRGGHGSANE